MMLQLLKTSSLPKCFRVVHHIPKYHMSNEINNGKNNSLYIIDGTALLFKAYFGKENMKIKSKITETLNGVNVSAIVAMMSKLCYFIEHVNCQHIAIVFDQRADVGDASGTSVLRKTLLPTYKSNRIDVCK